MEPGVASERERLERVLRGGFDPADVLPRLARLARTSPPGSPNALFAERQLAELLAEKHPWRAAIHAKRVLAHAPEDDGAWALLGFCQTLLRNYRFAAHAYRQAVSRAPANPSYLHNLGHILDMALARPAEAIGWLRAAHEARPNNLEMLASYAHALARGGRVESARELLGAAAHRSPSGEILALLAWLDAGAPAKPKRRRRAALERALDGGLAKLPFDDRMKAQAMLLARDVGSARPGRVGARATAELAAAVAYAIVYVHRLPLSTADVAAPFRAAVGEVRGRFAELRARLDLLPGDARYASRA